MSNTDQNESGLPVPGQTKRETASLLPRIYRTDDNKKFLQSTLDQLTQPGTVKKVNAFIGRQNSKSTSAADVFLSASDSSRQSYQLEPAAVITDYLGNVSFYKDYVDHINHIDVFGGNVSNHERLNKQESYSWNPHISWDKFVNYQNYYWMPYGPKAIEVHGQQQLTETEYPVSIVDDGGTTSYVFDETVQERNPTIILYRGQTYTFKINSPHNPFIITTSNTTNALDQYDVGVEGNGTEVGTVTFRVSKRAPDVLYYGSNINNDLGGMFKIFDINDNTYLNVNTDIINKTSYKLPSGIALSNGMKLRFRGNVEPAVYASGYWYVEGVGSAITLISEQSLEFPSTYTPEVPSAFDAAPFDSTAFDSANSFSQSKDYLVINRASMDKNPWTRANRWFHQDVITLSAKENGAEPVLDQSFRAIRPIIEFNANLKLFNFGHVAKASVNLIDTTTKDVFSTIEGTLGYHVDGVALAQNMRVLFAADTDPLVKNKIYTVDFINVTAPGQQISFNAADVSVDDNEILFSKPHALADGSTVTYLNNGYPTIEGLVNRTVYYVNVIDEKTIKLYKNNKFIPSSLVDIESVSSGFQKLETFIGKRRQIRLVETADAEAVTNQTILVKQGAVNTGRMYWFNGSNWVVGPEKLGTNQAPLFDVFDKNGDSFSRLSTYNQSNFAGTSLFSYTVGSGTNDVEMGFPLSYRSINNIGDISFTFGLLADTFDYKRGNNIITESINAGFIKRIKNLSAFDYENGWVKTEVPNTQPIVRIFKESGLVNKFPIDVFDDMNGLNDLRVVVYINGTRLGTDKYTIETGVVRKFVILDTDVTANDIVTLKLYTAKAKNEIGHYDIPVNLQNNPLNDDVSKFTLGQVIDHVGTIIENLPVFSGSFPGSSNLRDLPQSTQFGTRFLQHTGSVNSSLYHLGSKSANIMKAMEEAAENYGKFKRAFIVTASNTGIEAEPKQHVDYILAQLTKDKPKTAPYYLSDMFAHSGSVRNNYVVLDSRTKTYPLNSVFSMSALSNKSVLIYLNNTQLVYGTEYIFQEDFFTILVDLAVDDDITAYEYSSTDGSYCPPTPTKLGLYPKFKPKKYVDDTFVEPTEVIQGHDGSITVAFGDYRDDLILELETRIYNNIKIDYDPEIFDIYDFIPGYNRSVSYTKEEADRIMAPHFYKWTTLINDDFTKPVAFDTNNPFTYNYRENYAPDGSPLPASWRGIYKWMLDTDRPHICPWEVLGFNLKPTWWNSVYGPAPYTSDNLLLWGDLEKGIVREPNKSVKVLSKFKRPFLAAASPVDESGNLLNPIAAGMAYGATGHADKGFYVFGDSNPVESAWRRSSYYAFALIQSAILMKPNHVFGLCYDRSRIVKNLAGQYVYSETNLRFRLADAVLPSNTASARRIQTAGLVNYIVDHITSDVTARVDQYQQDLKSLTNHLGSKLGGFSSKQKFRLLMDSKSPNSSSGNFVPEENYDITLNTSSPIKKLIYSGVVITRLSDGYEITGYGNDTSYFEYNPYTESGRTVRVGGISEGFSEWTAGYQYLVGKVVKYSSLYYRTKVTHVSTDTFQPENFTRLTELPINGGVEAVFRKTWDTKTTEVLNFGTKLGGRQEVVDFLQGYGSFLTSQGFVFDDYNTSSQTISDWDTAAKEFLFWSSQGWPEGSNIAVSPAAGRLVLESKYSVVNNIADEFYEYQIFQATGDKLEIHDLDVYRNDNTFVMTSRNADQGIYGATLYLLQKEHVLLLNNKTIFNDVIYDLEPGYRQERLKVLGYITRDWYGGFNIPGFIYDQATIYEWQPWTDYHLGDIVKHKEFYYTAKYFVNGTEAFDANDWFISDSKPTSELLPNWDYRAEQFTDFYDLDTDNFDSEQQRMAQHLIGYQKRQYLENIIKDDVSQYKFYQGMILEKGTQNVFNKLFDVLSANDKESLVFNEEWAVRTGEFGATDIFEEVEFILDEHKFKINPQPVQLFNSQVWRANRNYVVGDIVSYLGSYYQAKVDHSAAQFDVADWNLLEDDLIYQMVSRDVYIKPRGYDSHPFPLTTQDRYLRTPGYVRYEDVDHSIDSLQELPVSGDINSINNGDYVWTAFEPKINAFGDNWNVYQYEKIDATWAAGTNADGMMLFNPASPDELIDFPVLQIGAVVGIKSDTFSAFATITDIDNAAFTINGEFSGGDELENIEVFVFNTRRFDTIMDITTNGKAWIENINDPETPKKWAVVNKNGSVAEVLREQSFHADASKIKKAFLYNKETNQIVKYLDVIDPIYGKIAGPAEQELRYKTYYDPAVYSVGTSSVNVIEEANWTDKNVGQLWWDLTRAKFIDNQDATDTGYTSITWNQLYKTASIDVYEWVESEYLPSEWDLLADTEAGLTAGISGKSKYGDEVYSIKQRYDNVSSSLINTYYFWVKNKNTIPEVNGRAMSASSVASLIANPKETGYQCIALLGDNAFNLVNVAGLLDADNVVLSIQYWIVENTTLNVHSEWKLISEHPNTSLPKYIERKWIDSLIGYDFMDRQLPNYSLPTKQRYGVENKPRQSMFINRIEALKQFIERTNSVLASRLIVDDYDISPLYNYDKAPSDVSGKWDIAVDTEEELRFIGTALLKQAVLVPFVDDGRIVDVTIVDPGYGYTNNPTITITGGNGKAQLSASVNTKGEIVEVTIDNAGEAYELDPFMITVRPVATLVRSDSGNADKWRIYHWYNNAWNYSIPASQTYIEQKYDVTNFWSYKDWYDVGYNQFTKIDHVVANTSKLYVSNIEIGEVVKIRNVGTGGWLLLKKFSNVESIDYTQSYVTIGRQNGTIQFSSKLYTYDQRVHVPTATNPDPYASVVAKELKVIIEAIKNNIMVDELYVEYLKLFFASVRYILSEQIYVDWLFKTSFVKITHNVGELQQKPTYNSDNLESFEEYVNEVKPYRTKIREYISVYDNTEHSNTSVADFELPTVVSDNKAYTSIYTQVDAAGNIITGAGADYIDQYPWKHWKDNVGFSVQSIELVNGGSGYISAPIVRITGGFGEGATATAFITNGRVTRLKLVSSGTGYLAAPTITFMGGLDAGGTHARAVAMIESEVVRSTKLAMKFDRISNKYLITDIMHSEQLVGNGVRVQFRLAFSPDLRTNTYNVMIDNIDVIKSEYSMSVGKETTRGYTSYYGILTFDNAPADSSSIIVSYRKNIQHLSATDRINFYYEPSSGEFGKQLGQLMSGVDYAGVVVTGEGFDFARGWDTIPWASDTWDSYDPGYDNFTINALHGTTEISLPYTPEIGERINIYINDVRVDDNFFGTNPTNPYAAMPTFIGDGRTDVITIPSSVYDLPILEPAANIISELYQDANIIIRSGTAEISTSMVAGATVDQFAPNTFKSIRYQLQFVTINENYTCDMVLIQSNGKITLSSGDEVFDVATGSLDIRLPDSSILGTFTISNKPVNGQIQLKFIALLADVSLGFVEWMFTEGNKLAIEHDNLSDSNFEIRSDVAVAFSEIPNITIDEFKVEDFYSADYYVQVSQGATVYVCDLNVIQNGSQVGLLDVQTPICSFTAAMNDGYVQIIASSTVSNIETNDVVSIVFAKIGLAATNNRPVFASSLRRLSDSNYTISPFDFETVTKKPVVVDTFNILRTTSVRYQIQLLSGIKIQTVHLRLMVTALNTVEMISTTDNIISECGSFSAKVVGDTAQLIFKPVLSNVLINSVKTSIFVPRVIDTLSNYVMRQTVVTRRLLSRREVTVDSFDISYNSVKYAVQMTTPTGYRSCDLTLVNDGTTVYFVRHSDIAIRLADGVFRGVIEGDKIVLKFTPGQTKTDLVMIRTLVGETIDDLLVPDAFSDANVLMDATDFNNEDFAVGTTSVIDSFTSTLYSSGRYFVELYTSTGKYHTVELSVVTSGRLVDMSQFGDNGTDTLGTFAVSMVGDDINIKMTNTSSENVRARLTKTMMARYNNLVPSDPSTVTSLIKQANVLMSSYHVLTTKLTPVKIDSFAVSDYTSGRYRIQMISGTNVNVIELHLHQDTTTIRNSQFDILVKGVSCGSFTTEIERGVVVVYFTPALFNVSLTYLKTLINGQIGIRGNDDITKLDKLSDTDSFTFRKQTSDGALPGTPYDPETNVGFSDYDTQLVGGFFQDSNIVGFKPEDLVVDGDGFVTETTSYAPEEVLPGYVSETVSIKVYQLPTPTSAYPDLLDAGIIIANDRFADYITRAPWGLGKVKASVSVRIDGGLIFFNCHTFRTTESHNCPELVGIRFGQPLPAGAEILYLIESTDVEATPVVDYPTVEGTPVELSEMIEHGALGFMQFKDTLNRVHYKRMNGNRTTHLVEHLAQDATVIYVNNANLLAVPNVDLNLPGVVEINGERIEYFVRNTTNHTLSQLTRGTLGTGVPANHKPGTNVKDISARETVPYKDSEIITNFKTRSRTTVIALGTTAINRDESSDFAPTDQLEVYVGGTRLKKDDYEEFDETSGHPENAAAGIATNPAQFTVNGSRYLKLTTPAPKGVDVVVIKRSGRIWNGAAGSLDEEITMVDSTTASANFIKAVEPEWLQYLVDKYEYILSTDTNVAIAADSTNDTLELD